MTKHSCTIVKLSDALGRLEPRVAREIPAAAKKLPLPLLLIGFALALAACTATPPQGPAPASATPAVETSARLVVQPEVSVNAVMVGLVDHAAHNLWNVEREGRAPGTEADWEIVAEHAIQIAAAGAAITAGGTGPSDNVWARSKPWQAHAQRMSDAGAAALAAARGRNLDALITANGELAESCEACHKEFKPALPSEGIVHGHAHDSAVPRR